MPWRAPEPGAVPTLGWEVKDFIEKHCVIPDGTHAGEPFILSEPQLRFVLGMYELHEDAMVDLDKPGMAFIYDRGAQIVAPQKYGKGPLAAAIIIAEAYGPVLFDGWDATGQPVGRPWSTPLIQVTAVSEDQTDNVWLSLLPMIRLGDLAHDIPDTGETRINLPQGGRIEPVTASARSRLGQRITFAVQDEAHDWDKRNGGRKLADTQRRNLAGMGGRFLETGNAWDPAQDSVAQTTFEDETGVFKLFVPSIPGSVKNKRERQKVLKHLYKGSWWINIDRISSEIDNLLERGEIAQAERFFLNRVVPGEDHAFDIRKWDESARPNTVVPPETEIVIGVDGARYNDALAVIGTTVESGFQFVIGIWEKPKDADKDYEHPMEEVNGAVIEAFERWRVWRLYADPGSQFANIAPLVEQWQGKFGAKKVVAWLMTRPRITATMIRNYVSAVNVGDVTHDGNEVFARHIANARRMHNNVNDEDGRPMWVLSKESPHSTKKIDAAAAAALAWEARGDAIAAGIAAKGGYDDEDILCVTCNHIERHHVPECRACAATGGSCDLYVHRS